MAVARWLIPILPCTLKSFNNIAHLENDPKVHIQKYELPEEEQVYALVTRGNNE